jgi:L-asparaginase II
MVIAMTDLSDSPTTRIPRPLAHRPVALEVRGDLVESVHHGSVVVTSPRDEVLVSVGEPERPFYPRSTLKPLQAVGLLRAGLVLDDDLLALAAASHSGSAEHVARVRRILEAHDLDEQALGNAPDLPIGTDERTTWLRDGGSASRLTQNCSGQHAAMLATCAINGWTIADYLSPGHPVQIACRAAVEDLTGERIAAETTDECGTPLYAVSMAAMSRAYGALAADGNTGPGGKIARAMRLFPELVSGHDRDVSLAMRAQPGLLAKEGAEGVQLFGLPDGTGVAVKIADGAGRARMPVAIHALGLVTQITPTLRSMATVPVLGGGQRVGEVRATDFAAAS